MSSRIGGLAVILVLAACSGDAAPDGDDANSRRKACYAEQDSGDDGSIDSYRFAVRMGDLQRYASYAELAEAYPSKFVEEQFDANDRVVRRTTYERVDDGSDPAGYTLTVRTECSYVDRVYRCEVVPATSTTPTAADEYEYDEYRRAIRFSQDFEADGEIDLQFDYAYVGPGKDADLDTVKRYEGTYRPGGMFAAETVTYTGSKASGLVRGRKVDVSDTLISNIEIRYDSHYNQLRWSETWADLIGGTWLEENEWDSFDRLTMHYSSFPSGSVDRTHYTWEDCVEPTVPLFALEVR